MAPRKKRSHEEQVEVPREGIKGARKRGRPKVEHPAQSNAERRRIQIRMAQRAYRQRKEGAMDELKSRVADLSATIDNMNKAFEDCRKSLTSEGLLKTQASELDKVSRSYKQWMENIRNHGDSDSSESDRRSQETIPRGEAFDPKQTAPISFARNVPVWIDQSITQQHAAMQTQAAPPLGYGMITDDDLRVGSSRSSSCTLKMNTPAHFPDYQNSGALDGIRLNYPMSIFLRALDPPRTYSHQEPTLARRVHRACMEKLYEYVMDTDFHQQAFDRVFTLSSLPKDPNILAPGLRLILDRGPNEKLDGEIRSKVHVGGAGTHYSRWDPVGNYELRTPGTYVGVVTLETLKLLDSSIEENISLDIAGFEGQWFDPYDVEGYLNGKGIHIDPGATFVEADLSRLSSSPSSISSRPTETSLATGRRQLFPGQVPSASISGPWPHPQTLVNDPMVWGDLLGNGPLAFGTVGFSDSTGSWMNFFPSSQPGRSKSHAASLEGIPGGAMLGQFCMDPGFSDVGFAAMPHASTETPKGSAVIDVAKFIKDLVRSGRCLGRIPGFRREDVDKVLMGAVVQAY